MIKVGILSATGYMGGEVLRVLLDHPEVEIVWLSGRSGGQLSDYHPNLFGLDLPLIHPSEVTPCDVVFLTVPTSATLETIDTLLNQGARVIDLGSAFRLKDRQTWERVYGQQHTHWHLVEEAVYGITELHGREVAKARIVANPGCFSSAAILGLAPLIKHELIDLDHLLVDALSGTTGAGAELAKPAHHPEIGNNIVPYNVVDHRHTYEMEQELGLLAGTDVQVHFSPVYVPITRDVLDICHTFPREKTTREDILNVYRQFYRDHEFIKVYDQEKEVGVSWQYRPYPWVSAINGTNYCQIGLDYDERRNRLVIYSALDNVGKGGAQVGIENMNLMFGLDRGLGLRRKGLHPG